jgi:hypothetical protein
MQANPKLVDQAANRSMGAGDACAPHAATNAKLVAAAAVRNNTTPPARNNGGVSTTCGRPRQMMFSLRIGSRANVLASVLFSVPILG